MWQEDFDSSTGMVLFEKGESEGGVDLSVSYKLRSKRISGYGGNGRRVGAE